MAFVHLYPFAGTIRFSVKRAGTEERGAYQWLGKVKALLLPLEDGLRNFGLGYGEDGALLPNFYAVGARGRFAYRFKRPSDLRWNRFSRLGTSGPEAETLMSGQYVLPN
ncbi:hypothetical protein AVEN_240317-1 [Araneus ventricosus]|uniref:Uncharacterized protein n=1 Tax=Araneus ventricosus TaxID=182803 RepID=A0A4Y2FJ37_ARAVE|nr:hypothetical protein AVEN_240317-1 [Araneus ventricosus]